MATPHPLLTNRIIDALASGPRDKVELRNEVIGTRLTSQAFYKALAQLRAAEIVTVNKNTLSLSVVWLRRETQRLEAMTAAYHLPAYRSYFDGLKTGKKLLFRFKTLRELDLFWTQAILVAIPSAHQDAAILSILPHDWFEVLSSNFDVWYELLGRTNPHCNVITHGSSAEGRYAKHPGVSNVEVLYGENPIKQKESDYIQVIDDLIFEATLDERAVVGIRRAMQGETHGLEKIADSPGTFRLTIRRDERRAVALKKRFQKYFTLPLFN